MLTAAHVVRDNEPLQVEFNDQRLAASIRFIKPEKLLVNTSAGRHPDIALLHIANCPSLPWYPQLDRGTPGTDAIISMFGFGTDCSAGGDSIKANFDGASFHDNPKKLLVYRLRGNRMAPGLSGAPAYIEDSPSRIIGIAVETRDESFPFGGYVVPLSDILNLLSDVVPELDVVTSGTPPSDFEPMPDIAIVARSISSTKSRNLELLIDRAERERRQMRPSAAIRTSQEAVAMAEQGAPQAQLARALRTYAIALEHDQTQRELAKSLAGRAFALDEDSAADERVRAILAFAEHGVPESALEIITPQFTSELEIIRAGFLLSSSPSEARRIILALPPLDAERPRARRIRLWAAIIERNPSEMIALAEPLLIASREDFSISYIVLFAFYVAGIPTPLWPDTIEGWPEPIPSNEVIDTPSQRERFAAAAAIAETILRESEVDDTQREYLEIWRLACLCLNPETMADASAFARELIDRTAPNVRALSWIDSADLLSRGELDPIVERITESVNSGEPSPEAISILATLDLQTEKAVAAENLLLQHPSAFRTAPELSRYRSLLAHARALQGNIAGARAMLDGISIAQDRVSVETTIRIYDGPAESAHHRLVKFYKECGNMKVLLIAANRARSASDWNFLAENGPLLLPSFRNIATARLAMYGAFNTQAYATVLEIYARLAEYQIEGTADLLRLRALSLDRLASNDALSAFADLLRVDPSDDNLHAAGFANMQRGDLQGTATLAREVEKSDVASPRTRLAFAMWIRPNDAELAARLWRLSMPAAAADDQLVLLAFSLAHDLGLDGETAPLREPMHRLGLEGRGGIQLMSQEQAMALLATYRDRGNEIAAQYRKGEISIHALTSALNTDLYNTHVLQLELNRGEELRNATAIYVRHGARSAVDPRQPLQNLFLDATSYFVAIGLDILETIVDKRNVFVSRSLGALLSGLLSDRASEPTPERRARTDVLQDIRADRYTIEPTTEAAIEDIAKRRDLTIVDWVTSKNVSRYAGEGISWCSPIDVLDWLKDAGRLGVADYHRAISTFGVLLEKREVAIRADARFFPQFNVTELLYQAGIRSQLASGRNTISQKYVDYLEIEEAKELRKTQAAQWLRKTIEQLQHLIETDKIKLLSEPPLPEGEQDTTLDVRVLRAAFSPSLPKDSLVSVDDRQITAFLSRDDGVAIGSLWDVARALVDDKNGMSLERFLGLTTEMRRRALMYIPVEEREIVALLRSASVVDSSVVETEELRVLECYIASALLDKDAIYAKVEPSLASMPAQITFLFELAKSVRRAVDAFFSSGYADDRVRARWAVEHLSPEGLPGYGVSGFQHIPPETVIDAGVAAYIAETCR